MPRSMHRNVETLLGRLATDPDLRDRFLARPAHVLTELVGFGVELTPVECAALATIDPDALRKFALALDSRLQRMRAPS